MLIVSIEHLQPGMVLGKSLFSAEGRVLLASGVPLTAACIKKLKSLGIASIFVQYECTQDISLMDPITEETRQQVIELTREAMESAKFRNVFVVEELQQQIDSILLRLTENKDILLQLTDIRAQPDYTFGHSVNVCIIALIIGMAMGYSEEKLRTLGLGALLHDIGKGKIPQSILEKPGKLNAEEFLVIQEHSKYGFDMLYANGGIDTAAALIAFQHHERYDGKGYPWKLERDGISEYSRIVAVADVYDALTTDRVYRRSFLPHEALQMIEDQIGEHFDPLVVRAFKKFVAVYPVGCLVQLNTRQVAFVAAVSPDAPTRPVVRVGKKRAGVRHYQDIDLREHTEYYIRKIIRS